MPEKEVEKVLLIPVGSSVALGVSEDNLGAVCSDMGQSQAICASRLASPNNNSEFYLSRSCLYSSECTCSLAYVREFGFLTATELFLPFSNDETEVQRRVPGYTVVSGKAMDW